jgi:hypothetical protein
VGIAAPANGAGHTHILLVMVNEHWKREPIRRHMENHGVPHWALWCYDNVSPDGTPDHIWNSSIGYCVDSVIQKDNELRIDFSRLRTYLAASGETRLVSLVDADIATIESRPYLLVPFGFTATRWFAAYSKEMSRFSQSYFWSHPKQWLMQLYLIHRDIWMRHGPMDLEKFVTRSYAIRFPENLQTFFQIVTKQFGNLMRLVYKSIPLVLLVTAFALLIPKLFRRYAGGIKRPAPTMWPLLYAGAALDTVLAKNRGRIDKWNYIQAAISERWNRRELTFLQPRMETLACMIVIFPGIFLMAFIFCGTVGTENERFFQQILPHLCILGSVFGTRCAQVIWRMAVNSGGNDAGGTFKP